MAMFVHLTPESNTKAIPGCGSTAIQRDHLFPNGITAFTSSTSNTTTM